MENNEIQLLISGIRVSGTISIAYWSIIFTNDGVYFVNHGNNYVPGIYGALADIFMSIRSRKNPELEEALSKSKAYYFIDKNHIESITVKKKLLNTSVSFPIEDDKKYTIHLSGSKLANFKKGLELLKS